MIEREVLANWNATRYSLPETADALPQTYSQQQTMQMMAQAPVNDQPGFSETSLPTFARGVAETGVSVAKGFGQAFVGFPGDIESIGRGLLSNLDPEAVKRVQSSPAPFVRAFFELVNSGLSFEKFIEGLEQDTLLPTTEDVSEFIEGTGIIPEMAVVDADGVAPAELAGELLAPVTYIRGAKQAASAVATGAKAVKKAVTKRGAKTTMPPTQQEPN